MLTSDYDKDLYLKGKRAYHAYCRDMNALSDHSVFDVVIPKSNLIDGGEYFGVSRNATVAKWSAERNEFVYMRIKFMDTFEDTLPHPEDDDGHDIFVPLQLINEKTESD